MKVTPVVGKTVYHLHLNVLIARREEEKGKHWGVKNGCYAVRGGMGRRG